MLWISLALVALSGIGITGVEAAGRPVSENSRCGREFGGATCQGSKWGDCCSQYGYCGRTKDYCEVSNRCQQGFGTCSGGGNNIPSVSQHSTLQTSTRPSSSIRTSTASSPPSASVPSSSSVASSSSLGPSVPISQSICSVVTVTASAPDEVVTVTVPGDAEIITQISTLTASETIPVTLPVVTETLPPVTETLPAITVTLPPVTETLPAVTQTLPPVTDISIATTTTTLSPSTTTVASCPTGNPLRNGDFESGLPGSWSTLTAGDADVSRVAMSGGYALAARINVGNANLPQRVIQAISVCNSVQYQVSFQARRTTTAGVVSAVLYVNDTPLAGGIITSTAFVAVGQINGGIFSSAGGSSIVRLEFTFSGNAGTAKEVQVDNVVFTPV